MNANASKLAVVDYLWYDEKTNFENKYNVTIGSNDTLYEWIGICEASGWTDHIFYHLMVLKYDYTLTV